ncbi:MAG: tetratricopeptide repeat protein [Chloroflexales bacterium]|nr:tetratricopeptide repeat protein [Chloroflexales bacterium]
MSIGDDVIPAEAWRRRKVRRLIELVALSHGHRLHREQLMDRLWPDADPQSVLNNLHQTLYLARRLLDLGSEPGPGHLLLQDEVVTLAPAELVWVDVTAFEQAAALAHRRQDPEAYRAALDLYAGELLPESRYDEWVNARREALCQEHVALLLAQARLAEMRTEYALAIESLQRVLASDPLHEEAHRDVMRVYTLAGARQQAIRQYQALQESLQRELGVAPAPESQRLYQDILAGQLRALDQSHGPPASPAAIASDPPAPPHNLPFALTSFIGRGRELVEVQRLLATTRLLMIAGPGGSGKTRLALEAAAGVLSAYRDGVWLVELAALADAALVPQVVAAALGVREVPGQPLVQTLAQSLYAKQLLLLLDNCEHMVDACARLATTLLQACPQLRILATSRERLQVPGEVVWLTPALALPDPEHARSLADLLHVEAVQLFIDRAQAVAPSFQWTDQHASALARICVRLDGMPLAIELAAARVTVLTLEQLAERLHTSFRLLVSGNRTALTRQQTLTATLDWSYDLLTEAEQALLRRLAVFAGGFALEAAERICAGNGADGPDVLELLMRLTDKSLVMVRDEQAERRYWLLEPVRQYSLEKLRGTDEAVGIRERHRDWYLALATRASPNLRGPHQEQWKGVLRKERDNFRAALEWSLDAEPQEADAYGFTPGGQGPQHDEQRGAACRPRLAQGLRLAKSLTWYWYLDDALSEGRAWFERALAQTGEAERSWTRASALTGAGQMALHQGHLPMARAWLEAGSAILRAFHEPHDLAMALFLFSVAAINQGEEQAALASLQESSELFRAVGDQDYYALTLLHRGDVALQRGDGAAARAFYEQSLTIQRQLGSRWSIAQLLNNLGEVARCEGDYPRAARLYEESLALFHALGSSSDIARSFHNLGHVAHVLGDGGRAAALFARSMALFRERGNQRGAIECVAGLAGVIGAREPRRRHAALAAQLLGAASAQFAALGAKLWPADQLDFQRNEARIRAVLGETAFAEAWNAGQALTLEQAMKEALATEESEISQK